MKEYKELVRDVLANGKLKQSRNGNTISLIGTQLKFDASDIPLLNSRKIFYKGVLGEFSAFMNYCWTVKDFKDRGCNYWDEFADEKGQLNLDYVEQLHEANIKLEDGWYSQIDALKIGLVNDKYSRRHIINLWVPSNIHKLSLPCCHFNYQFIVDTEDRLNMIWTQRSADVMLGVPSDMILAYLWIQCLCKELGLKPGIVTMNFGDTHIYEEHIPGANTYLENIIPKLKPIAKLNDSFTCIEKFKPDQLDIVQYDPHPVIKFELKV